MLGDYLTLDVNLFGIKSPGRGDVWQEDRNDTVNFKSGISIFHSATTEDNFMSGPVVSLAWSSIV